MMDSVAVERQGHFAYHQIMDADSADAGVSGVAAAIAEPARTRMLCCLMDGRARTSTELAIVGQVSPSTASVHLARLRQQRLVKVLAQGKHRYYSLENVSVAAALEALTVIAGGARDRFVPNTPTRLRAVRTCYDHLAGALAVSLHDRLLQLGWLSADAAGAGAYDLSREGEQALAGLGVDIAAMRAQRRRFACACLDWSERRPHLGGAVGAALLHIALQRKWVLKDLDSRVLSVTARGRREMQARLGLLWQ
jgi:DNA-binding transcriptional ArsR family regulator